MPIKDNLKIIAASDIVRSTNEAKIYIEELGTFLCVKSVEDSPSVLSLGRLCDEVDCPYS